jgi:hypothetical protein
MSIETAQTSKPAMAATGRIDVLIQMRDDLQAQIDRLEGKNGQVKAFLDTLNGQIGPYAMQDPDVYAVLLELWEEYKTSNPAAGLANGSPKE